MEIYWLLRLPHLHKLLNDTCFTLFIISFCLTILTFLSFFDDDDVKFCIPYRWLFLKILSLVFLLGSINCFIPTKSDLALMMGWDAIKSDTVQEVIEILKDKIK